ncbi:Uncharacterised protein [Dermacoccus nishinomiyaensis]|nr:Uncharacterised protein [Dermacoccus nishinomiyaensis]
MGGDIEREEDMTEVNDAEHPTVPSHVRLELVHAYMQIVADACGADILHVKGAAIHPELSDGRRGSLDVDILVRPDHVDLLLAEMQERGWKRVTGFEEGSAFGHAMNLSHPLGMVDLHRKWPGFEVSPEDAFEALWAEREQHDIADVACTVPSLPAQRLILLLHYGRSGGQRAGDLERGWNEADGATREALVALSHRFRADLALAAATGNLDAYRSDPGYRLWHYFSRGTGGRFEEWWGRWNAAQGAGEKARVIRAFLIVNDDLLRAQLGREPSTRDYVDAYLERLRHAGDDVRRLVTRVGEGSGRERERRDAGTCTEPSGEGES